MSEEQHPLMKEGIIEQIDASPWISPIVVPTKKEGKPRLCVDLREPNKAIATDSHPFPHMGEFMAILLDPDHSSVVRDAPPPHDLPSLLCFLCLVSWYSKFLPNFGTVVKPIQACNNTEHENYGICISNSGPYRMKILYSGRGGSYLCVGCGKIEVLSLGPTFHTKN
ncbi:hypothetical protein CCH79_00017550 [Gambusia affinis]|uniref:Uncharacterized protein n=1 Tax=Gambusia affinis TaxID=33528 RepID=A0A315VYE2_GAMAF|nr:hypothetical protein CCH79_00017550 [Gambusia affinis]